MNDNLIKIGVLIFGVSATVTLFYVVANDNSLSDTYKILITTYIISTIAGMLPVAKLLDDNPSLLDTFKNYIWILTGENIYSFYTLTAIIIFTYIICLSWLVFILFGLFSIVMTIILLPSVIYDLLYNIPQSNDENAIRRRTKIIILLVHICVGFLQVLLIFKETNKILIDKIE